MRIHKHVTSIVIFVFAIILFSPHLSFVTVSCHDCSIVCDTYDSHISMAYISDFQFADVSFQIESAPSCANYCGKQDGNDTHCHEMHCQTGTSCELTYTTSVHKFNINQCMFKENLNYKEQLAFDELIFFIFKPPEFNA